MRNDNIESTEIDEPWHVIFDDINKSIVEINRKLDKVPSKSFYLKVTVVAVLVQTTIAVAMTAYGL